MKDQPEPTENDMEFQRELNRKPLSSAPPSAPLEQRLREQADYVERLETHDDMGLSMALSQTADMLRWAADALRQPSPETPQEPKFERIYGHAECLNYPTVVCPPHCAGADECAAVKDPSVIRVIKEPPAVPLSAGPAPAAPTQDVLLAPCRWCGYNGAGYWQKDTHAATCPWWKVSGIASRMAVLRDHPTECKPLLAPELAPIDHVAYVRDCLADPAVWPRFERPVLQALIDEINRLERGTGHEPTR